MREFGVPRHLRNGRFVNGPDTDIVAARVLTWLALAVVNVNWFLEFLIETKGTSSIALCIMYETLHSVSSWIRVRLPVCCS